MRRGDDSGVHADGLGITEPLDLPFFEHPQQLHLGIGRQVADLVEKNGGAIRELEAPDLPIRRAGERPFLPAEQLALEQGVRHRGAVDPHHGRARRALSSWMYVASSSLPVPVSPRINTVASVTATSSASSRTRRSAGLSPTSMSPLLILRFSIGANVHPGKRERNCEVCQYALEKLTGRQRMARFAVNC